MCKVMEDMCNQAAAETMRVAAYRMFEVGKNTLEEIATVTGISVDELKKIKAEQGV